MFDIIKAVHLGGYLIKITFENGKEGVADLEDYSKKGGIFRNFIDPEYFRKFRINEELGVLFWPNGEDIAPETIYSLATGEPLPDWMEEEVE